MGVAREELSFGPSTSSNTYVLAQAVRKWLAGTGGAVVVTNQDHEANSGVWRRLAEEGIEAEVDALLQRQRGRDPDLWIIEVEDRQGRTLLDQDGIKD